MNKVPASLAAIAALYATAASGQSVQHTVTDLGTLGGASTQSCALGINNNGQVVGWATDPTTGYFAHAFYWAGNGAAIQDLGTLAGQTTSVSLAAAINNNGWVAGESDNSGFLWTGAGPMLNIGSLGGSTTHVYGYGLNNAGVVVGDSQIANGAYHGFIYSNGVMTDTGTFAGIAVNDSGLVAGDINSGGVGGTTLAYVRAVSGTLQPLGTLGGTWTQPNAMNGSGQVAGFATTAGGVRNAFLYTGGVMTDLGTLGGMDTSDGMGINGAGDVVGQSYHQLTGGAHAFLYTGGAMLDLNSLIDPSSRWTLECANAINDNGQIVGIGISPDGDEHAFLLTPSPEPSTFVLLIIAACSLLSLQHCHRRRSKLD
jgi:probable HAF family extracellular repeat protein